MSTPPSTQQLYERMMAMEKDKKTISDFDFTADSIHTSMPGHTLEPPAMLYRYWLHGQLRKIVPRNKHGELFAQTRKSKRALERYLENLKFEVHSNHSSDNKTGKQTLHWWIHLRGNPQYELKIVVDHTKMNTIIQKLKHDDGDTN